MAGNDPEAANKLVKEIIRGFALLRDHPHSGREQERLVVNPRSFVVKNYYIFYRPFDGGVEILRVLHGSRGIGSMFEDFFDSL